MAEGKSGGDVSYFDQLFYTFKCESPECGEKFKKILETIEESSKDESLDQWLIDMQRRAVKHQLADFERQISDYERLRSGQPEVFEANSLVDLSNGLIRARIASGMTQKDLAEKLGLKAQQIQRYESLGYSCASLTRLVEVIQALSIEVSLRFRIGGTDTAVQPEKIDVVSE